MTPMNLSDGTEVHSILECETHCKILWQRDVNASKNRLGISNSIWYGLGYGLERPPVFNRSKPITVKTAVPARA